MLIPLLLVTSSLILQVHTICQCAGRPPRCYDCPCESDICDYLTSDPPMCRKGVLNAFSCELQNCEECGEEQQCIHGPPQRCYKCDCGNQCQRPKRCISESMNCCNILIRKLSCSQVPNCTGLLGCSQNRSQVCPTTPVITTKAITTLSTVGESSKELQDSQSTATPVATTKPVTAPSTASESSQSQDTQSTRPFSKDARSMEDSGSDYKVIIAVLVCVVVIILIAIVSITLICFWRFKLKMTQERHNYAINTGISSNMNQDMQAPSYDTVLSEPDGDPLYSVLDTDISSRPPHYTHPPQLPASRPPLYEEIQDSITGTSRAVITPSEYEQPMKTLTTDTTTKTLKTADGGTRGIYGYQEHRYSPQGEDEKKKCLKSGHIDDNALNRDSLTSQDKEEKTDRQKSEEAA